MHSSLYICLIHQKVLFLAFNNIDNGKKAVLDYLRDDVNVLEAGQIVQTDTVTFTNRIRQNFRTEKPSEKKIKNKGR